MDSKNKRIVLVTGATGGLGTAMCKNYTMMDFMWWEISAIPLKPKNGKAK
jgi:FlaA1/EpsC-like NDP-sugar epimerase